MSRKVGAEAEDLAISELEKAGYKILERNFFARVGEIDIIAEKDKVICFVEVKYRHSNNYGTALEAVTGSKIRKIIKSAKKYLYDKKLFDQNWRIDVVAIERDGSAEIIRNVFTEGM